MTVDSEANGSHIIVGSPVKNLNKLNQKRKEKEKRDFLAHYVFVAHIRMWIAADKLDGSYQIRWQLLQHWIAAAVAVQ
jgi:hypothetical protein